MRRLFLIACLLLGAALPAAGQGGFTTVSGTIVGAVDGLTWSCGTITAQLITAGGVSPTLNGGGFSTSVSPVTLGCPTSPGTGAPGSFTMRLADSGQISPSTTTWQFTVNMTPGIAPPAGTGPQSFTYTTAINCSTNTPSTCTANAMSISAQLSALAPKLSNASGSGSSFPVTTAVNVNSGGSINVQPGGSISAAPGGTVTATNGVGATGAPIMGLYLSNSCPVANTGQCYFTFADTRQDNTCSWVSTGPTVTCTDGPFLSTDCVGGSGCTGTGTSKSAMGWQTCATDQPSTSTGQGQISNTALVTIASFISATQVTLSANPGATATLQTSYPQGACLIYGHLDDTGASTFDSGLQASLTCPQGIFPSSYYFFTTPHFFTDPPACLNIGPGIGANYGNLIIPAGMHLEGRGPGATTWELAPSFPNGNPCTNTGGSTTGTPSACFAVTLLGQWDGIRLDGGSQAAMTQLNSKNLLVASVASLRDVTLTNLGGYNTSQMVCVELNHDVQLWQVNLSGCGEVGFIVDTNTGNDVCHSCAVENNSQSLRVIGPNAFSSTSPQFICFYCNFLQLNPNVGTANINNRGGSIQLYGSSVRVFSGGGTGGLTGYLCNTTAGCTLSLFGSNMQYQFGAGGNTAINCTVTCTTFFSNSALNSFSGGFDIEDVAGSKEFDLGGNTTTNRFSISGNVYGAASITGTQQVTTNIVLSGLGTGLTAPSSASGDSLNEVFTYTLGTAPGANGTATVTFPTPFWSATGLSCSAQVIGGTTPAILPIAVGTPSVTAVTLTYLGTFTTGTVITRLTCGY
jgi:hypothetical protein